MFMILCNYDLNQEEEIIIRFIKVQWRSIKTTIRMCEQGYKSTHLLIH